MTTKNPKTQKTFETLSRKWWFVLVFILLDILIPPFASKGYDPSSTGEVIGFIIRNSLFSSGSLSLLYPVFKVLPLILILGIIFTGNRFRRIFSLYAGVNFILIAVLQYISISDTYGFAVVSGNFILTLFVAFVWFREFALNKNDFSPRKMKPIGFLLVPLAFIAFWYPLNLESMRPDFALNAIFTNSVGLAFCNMTPVYLTMLILWYPTVNIVTLRLTSLLGLIVGCWNLLVNFIFDPEILWWNGVLHLPLVIISLYALILSFRKAENITNSES